MEVNDIFAQVLSCIPEAKEYEVNASIDMFLKQAFNNGNREILAISKEGFNEDFKGFTLSSNIYQVKSIFVGKVKLEEQNLADIDKEYKFYADILIGEGGLLSSCFDFEIEENVMALLASGFRPAYYIGNSNKLYLNFKPLNDLKCTVVSKVTIDTVDDRFEALCVYFVLSALYLRRPYFSMELSMYYKNEYERLKYTLLSREKRNNRFGFMGGQR